MNTKTLRLTLVTPTYNQVGFISKTMQSVLDQQLGPRLEYIIQDACSCDGTESIVRSFEPAFRQQGVIWRYVREKDAGQSDAVNRGWQGAEGDILGYLNSDDTLLPGALKTMLDFFQLHTEVAWAYGGWQLIGATGRVHKTVMPHRYSRTKLLNHSLIGQPSCFFRRALLEEVGGLNPELHLAMDYDLWLRISEAYPAKIIPAVLSALRYHTAAKSSASVRAQLKEILRINTRYTRVLSWRRLCQYFYYARGLAVVLIGRHISRRVGSADRRHQ